MNPSWATSRVNVALLSIVPETVSSIFSGSASSCDDSKGLENFCLDVRSLICLQTTTGVVHMSDKPTTILYVLLKFSFLSI
jgi:hypothetical protein